MDQEVFARPEHDLNVLHILKIDGVCLHEPGMHAICT